MSHCGSCTMCCKVMGVKGEVLGVPIKKPRAGWCEHCAIGVGCKVYPDRPTTCRTFQCMWLAAKEAGMDVPDDLRPDRSGVVFAPSTSDEAFSAHMDKNKPDAWRRHPAIDYINAAARSGLTITLDYGDYSEQKRMIRYRNGNLTIETIRFTPPDKDGMQWNIP